MKKKIITAYLRYANRSASVRQRFLEYENELHINNYILEKKSLFSDKYFIGKIINSKLLLFSVIISCFKRIIQVLFQKKVNLIIIQGELLPYFPNLLERLIYFKKIPFILDIDDAFFHRYDNSKSLIVKFFLKKKFKFIFSKSKTVFAGSKYLKEYAIKNGAKNVIFLPTGVNCKKYDKFSSIKKNDTFSIVWIGSPSTTQYIIDILPPLNFVCLNNEAIIRLIGAKEIQTNYLPLESFEWSEQNEIYLINQCHLGIMPLSNNNWEKGKCGFKIIQYFASGIPVIASPVGANNQIVEHGKNGFLASTKEDWIKYINFFKNNPNELKSYGINARKKVKEIYSTEVLKKKFLQNIISVDQN